MAKKVSKYISGVGWRYDKEHHMNRRNSNLDYHLYGMAYMITLKVEEGAKLFGTLPTAAQLCAGQIASSAPVAQCELNSTQCEPASTQYKPASTQCEPASTQCKSASTQCKSDSLQCHATRRMIEERGSGMNAGTVLDFDRIPPEAVFTRLSPLGEALRKAWLTLPERFPNITIRDRQDEFCIMPEHFHGILFYIHQISSI